MIQELEPAQSCSVTGQIVSLQCFSFQGVHILQASYGRKLRDKQLCGDAKEDIVVFANCTEDVTERVRNQCQTHCHCSFPVDKVYTLTKTGCSRGQTNVLNVEHICGELAVDILHLTSPVLS
jgi:hypothetical protein